MNVVSKRVLSVQLALLVGSVLLGARAEAQHYAQTNLVADQPGAAFPDANLVNPWGLARSSTSVWWVANNRTGTATLYNGNTGQPATLIVTIPSAGGTDPGSPTGAAFNGTASFDLAAPGTPARFLFVTQDGTISGWNPGVDATHAVIKVTSPGAVYTGVAIASREGANLLYVANFAQGRIEVFDSGFHPAHFARGAHLGLRHYDGDDDHDGEHDGDRRHGDRFQDERIPRGFAPFNVQNIGGELYVTFAKQDPVINVAAGPGLGYVDVFNPEGRLLRRLEHGPWLNAPWGLALAPSDFGAFSHNLLVGQFRSGEIAAYDVASGAFLGKVLKERSDEAFAEDGLWALGFGNGLSAGPLNALFFTAGIENETHGLFGVLNAVAAEQLLGNGK